MCFKKFHVAWHSSQLPEGTEWAVQRLFKSQIHIFTDWQRTLNFGWLSITLYDFVTFSITIYDFLWLWICMTLYDYVLKYLEIKIEEWANRAKWGQSGPNGAKWCQIMPNRVKRVLTGLNGLKRGQKGPYLAKLGQKGQNGQTKPNEVKWGWFSACTHIFMRSKNHVLQPRPSD